MEARLLENFKRLIVERTGLHLREQDHGKLEQAVIRRTRVQKLTGFNDYHAFLLADQNSNDPEWKKFVALLTTAETFFFRDKGQFALLRDIILPEIIRRRQIERILRVWSAGCSTGEEPYSLAILIRELLPAPNSWKIHLIGTDINEDAIQRARQGIYSNWSFRMVDQQIQKSYFNARGADWELNREIQNMATLQTGNLRLDKFPSVESGLSDFDLILCRNVFIYFNTEAIDAVLKKFNDALVEGGYLLTGHSELYQQHLYNLEIKSYPYSIVYQKNKESRRPAAPPEKAERERAVVFENLPPISVRPPDISKKNFEPTLTHYSPTAVSKELHKPAAQPVIAPPTADILNRAIACLKNGQFKEAVAQLSDILKIEPKNAEAIFLMAQAHANMGLHDKALELCAQVLQIRLDHVKAYYLTAHIYDEKGQTEDAKNHYKKIIYVAPEYVAAYIELASLYEAETDFKRAQKMWSTALELLKRLPPSTPIDPYENVSAEKLRKHVEGILAQL